MLLWRKNRILGNLSVGRLARLFLLFHHWPASSPLFSLDGGDPAIFLFLSVWRLPLSHRHLFLWLILKWYCPRSPSGCLFLSLYILSLLWEVTCSSGYLCSELQPSSVLDFLISSSHSPLSSKQAFLIVVTEVKYTLNLRVQKFGVHVDKFWHFHKLIFTTQNIEHFHDYRKFSYARF